MKSFGEHIGKIVVTLAIAGIFGGIGMYYKMGKMETSIAAMKESQTKVLEIEVKNIKEDIAELKSGRVSQWRAMGKIKEDVTDLKVEIGKLKP